MKHQKVLQCTRRYANVQCLSCGTIQTVERDADGASIDQTPCHADDCTRRLCELCPQFECSDCHMAHCAAHCVRIKHETVCPVCVAKYVREAI